MAYREGSIYGAVAPADPFWVVVGLAMACVLILGLVLRERRGLAGIGFESTTVVALYLLAIAVQVMVW